jgi:hypothetical protein
MASSAELHERIRQLENELERLRDEIGPGPDGEDVHAPPNGRATSRRRWLTVAGATAAGAAWAGASSQRAAAGDPNDVVKDVDNPVSGLTRLSGGQFEARDAGATPVLVFPAAVRGVVDSTPTFNGVVGSTKAAGGYGLIGLADRTGGARSQLHLHPEGPPPPSDSQHQAGELAADGDGVLWYCVKASPGPRFVTLAGPAAAGAFYAIDPIRAFDSRVPAISNSGIFAPNSDRAISVKDGYDETGTVTAADAIPAGATAVTCTLTVTGTTGPNFLSLVPGDASDFTTSSINWVGANQSIANGVVTRLDAARQVRIFAGDQAGSAHAILDITGYHL